MTTAARPTFDHAKGKSKGKVSSIKHARELTQHTKIKYRKKHKSTNEDFESESESESGNETGGMKDAKRLKYDIGKKSVEELKLELIREERKKQGLGDVDDNDYKKDMKLIGNDDSRLEEEEEEEEESVVKSDISSDQGSTSSEEEDDDEDEDALLLEELNKIKRERAEEKARIEEEKLVAKAKISNPLLNYDDSENKEKEIDLKSNNNNNNNSKVKKSWRDQSVFKRDKSTNEKKNATDTFVNDMMKNDYHKKFMNKYVR